MDYPVKKSLGLISASVFSRGPLDFGKIQLQFIPIKPHDLGFVVCLLALMENGP